MNLVETVLGHFLTDFRCLHIDCRRCCFTGSLPYMRPSVFVQHRITKKIAELLARQLAQAGANRLHPLGPPLENLRMASTGSLFTFLLEQHTNIPIRRECNNRDSNLVCCHRRRSCLSIIFFRGQWRHRKADL